MKLIDMNQMSLTDIVRTLHPNTKEYTFFSVAQGTFPKIDLITGQKQVSKDTRRLNY